MVGQGGGMMLNYATLDDVKDALPDDLTPELNDTTLSRLTSHASLLIRRATKHATYSTDKDNMPTSTTIGKAFRGATVAQVRSWVEAGLAEDVLTGGVGVEPTLSSTSSNGKSITLDNSAADMAHAHLLGGGLGAEAELILDAMGLLGGLPGVYR